MTNRKKLIIILLIVVLIAAGLVIASFLNSLDITECTGTNCGTSKQNAGANMPFSKGPTGPPQVGTPNVPPYVFSTSSAQGKSIFKKRFVRDRRIQRNPHDILYQINFDRSGA